MACPIASPVHGSDAALHASFLKILPRIETHGRIFFRHLKCRETRAECIAEMVALTWRWFLRLMKRGKNPGSFMFNFCRFAAFAVKSGRKLCRMERPNDVLSERAQRERGFKVESLPVSSRTAHENLYAKVHGQREHDGYEERLKDNTVSPIPDQVAMRIDFPEWLLTWSERDRRIIKDMAQDERTLELSKKFGCCPARISQKRLEYKADWERFTADPVAA
jgi:hypothetical protein